MIKLNQYESILAICDMTKQSVPPRSMYTRAPKFFTPLRRKCQIDLPLCWYPWTSRSHTLGDKLKPSNYQKLPICYVPQGKRENVSLPVCWERSMSRICGIVATAFYRMGAGLYMMTVPLGKAMSAPTMADLASLGYEKPATVATVHLLALYCIILHYILFLFCFVLFYYNIL